ncbi:hypothetical protein GCM10009676_17360 [Prauserella halophila]|uniref:ANTAR domain-containing protein n=1 Tax=Prauserella halophila TaxID=185641 RepID=A0ABN1W9A9_9PSEU
MFARSPCAREAGGRGLKASARRRHGLIAAKLAMRQGMALAEVAAVIDDADRRIRDAVPTARLVHLEPDLDRTPA